MTEEADVIYVELRRSGKRFRWREEAESLLAFIEDHGVQPDFSCRAGICGTCKQTLISGAVDYFEAPLDPPESNEVFLCCSRPKTSVVIEL
jgi:ferredoxin